MTPAMKRTVAYMRDTGCDLLKLHGQSGVTFDKYQWPIPFIRSTDKINRLTE